MIRLADPFFVVLETSSHIRYLIAAGVDAESKAVKIKYLLLFLYGTIRQVIPPVRLRAGITVFRGGLFRFANTIRCVSGYHNHFRQFHPIKFRHQAIGHLDIREKAYLYVFCRNHLLRQYRRNLFFLFRRRYNRRFYRRYLLRFFIVRNDNRYHQTQQGNSSHSYPSV
ncbi:hypothetical protein [uncultured Parabacteroides sp.]|uniref:hypothetical protein n=1 Tax=uncultured Parabacteroides sp. TaxID=512312 RepID=UPI0026771929|nr:hypothetical protein [uncultured Parabacteroides sp.]